MKILIGTPIHESKDYSIDRWLKSVVDQSYPADLLLVDNSPDEKYIQKLKKKLKKHQLEAKIIRLNFPTDPGLDIRIQTSQETIRRFVLRKNYDAWFSWECDQIIPNDALFKLVNIMNEGNFMAVIHNSWARWDSSIINTNMGLSLVKNKILKKIRFLPDKNGQISQDPQDAYDIHDPSVVKKRILKAGGNYIEVFGAIDPIYHLER